MILVTGGLGFIGSHTVVELLENGKDVIVVDNLYNSTRDVLDKIYKICGKKPKFYEIDVLNYSDLDRVFKENNIQEVIHFAGYKAVGESCTKPIMYYENNVMSTINLIKVMEKYKANKFVFSSSATVYGEPEYLPYDEVHRTKTSNPYGESKLINEHILADYCKANENFKCAILRYFNPIGAHSTGFIGESNVGIPNNLMPYINKVVIGEMDYLGIFGDDYDTHDGTGVRDYIHVVDVAKGHILALDKLNKMNGIDYFNLGSGQGYSVLDLLKSYEKVIGKSIAYKIKPRRSGDIAMFYADVTKSKKELGFETKYGIDDMCRDSYNFIIKSVND